MSELPNVQPGEIIASEHINDIKDRSVQRYTDAGERDLLNPTPTVGDLAYLEDTNEVQVWDGTRWIMGGGGTLTGKLVIAQDVGTSGILIQDDEQSFISFEDENGSDTQRYSIYRDGPTGDLRIHSDAHAGTVFRVRADSLGSVDVFSGIFNIYNPLTTSSPANARLSEFESGRHLMQKSTAAMAYVAEGQVGPLLQRIDLEPPVSGGEGFDISNVLETIFDRFDAIEQRLDALEA